MIDKEAEAARVARAQQKVVRRETEAEDRAMRALLATADGRNFLWWLLRIGKVQLQPFSLDPNLTAFNCGELNVGQQVLARILDTEPAGYLQMLKEKDDARREFDASGKQDVPGSDTDSIGAYDE